MNTGSIRFRLTAWYVGILGVLLALFGVFIYLTLRQFLDGNLRETLVKEAQTIGETLIRDADTAGDGYVIEEIEEHFAPRITGRFVRVTRPDGSVLYRSGPPENLAFDPAEIPPRDAFEPWREVHLRNGNELLVLSDFFVDRAGNRYLIEAGAPYEDVERVLHGLLFSMGIAFPLIVAVAIGGGYLFMRQALKPLDAIASTAERITSRNLNERVPVVRTGDELEKLSVSLNRMMTRLEEAFHHVNRFSADASHEIRTPLAIIRAELEAALQAHEVTPQVRDTIESSLEETERLSRIVENLLEMSRLEAGEAFIDRTSLSFTEVARATVDQLRFLAQEKNIELQFKGKDPLEVEGDRLRLTQVVVNLVDNAIKYTKTGGSVSVSMFPSNGNAVLEVADTGIGVPPEAASQVFDRFYRADKARSRQHGGAGLGLAIVKSICTAHGGSVFLQSAEGNGAIFRVEIPLASNGRYTS